MKTGKTLVVIGGGAAGFFCAIRAAELDPELQVVILEKNNQLLSKLKVSGGGRCNVTHACSSLIDMCRNYPRGGQFLKKAFHHFFVNDTVQWFQERGVELKTEPDGRMFPVTDSSQTIIDCFLKEAAKNRIEIRLKTELLKIETKNEKFLLMLRGQQLWADAVCLAPGGFQKKEQFHWLEATQHTIVPPVPSLFTFNLKDHPLKSLMGISVTDVSIKIMGTSFEQAGPLLITHWGLSGPAVLKLSAWAARDLYAGGYDFKVKINWVPSFNENSLRAELQRIRFDSARQKIHSRNPFGLPARLWDYLLAACKISEDMRWADLPAKTQNLLVLAICGTELSVKGKTTFKEEFVTAGGIALDEVEVNSMESKLWPGLFFAGEILDIDGVTGGFNFQNAWTTAHIAANGICRRIIKATVE